MKFRLKMTLCMLGLLSVLFGVGGSLLISISFQNTLEREQQAAYNAYQMVVGTLRIVNSAAGQSDYADISSTLEQLSGRNGGGPGRPCASPPAGRASMRSAPPRWPFPRSPCSPAGA